MTGRKVKLESSGQCERCADATNALGKCVGYCAEHRPPLRELADDGHQCGFLCHPCAQARQAEREALALWCEAQSVKYPEPNEKPDMLLTFEEVVELRAHLYEQFASAIRGRHYLTIRDEPPFLPGRYMGYSK